MNIWQHYVECVCGYPSISLYLTLLSRSLAQISILHAVITKVTPSLCAVCPELVLNQSAHMLYQIKTSKSKTDCVSSC